MWKDRDRSMGLVERAAAAGYETLVVTVDVPVAGARTPRRPQRHDDPADPDPTHVVNAIPRPVWWYNLFTTEPLTFASLDAWGGTVADLLDAMFDPTVTYDDLRWLREQWSGKLVVKGIQSVDDARKVVDCGADGHHAVQPWRPTARPCTDPVPSAAGRRRRRSGTTRGLPRHRHHVRRRRRRSDRARGHDSRGSAAPTSTA